MTSPYGTPLSELRPFQPSPFVFRVLWQFKNGALGKVNPFDLPTNWLAAWDRSLGRRVYYQP